MTKQLLTVITGGVLAASIAAVDSAYAFEAKLSGQIARGVMTADDGVSSKTQFVDPDALTRFRFTGSEEIAPGLKAGILFEVEYLSNSSALVTNAARSVTPTLDERHILAYFEGGFGRLGVGQTDGAANAGIESDLSGTAIILDPNITQYGGAMPFRTSAGGTGPTITQVINNRDFESRYDLVRYDTPSFGPVSFAVSRGVKSNQDISELAARYSGDLGGVGKILAVLGYSTRDAGGTTGDVVTTGGSISWLASNGLNVTLANSKLKDDSAAPTNDKFKYFKVGYLTGKHAVALEYGQGDDQAAVGDKAKVTGVGYVYSPTKWADIFAGLRNYSLDRPGSPFEDIKLTVLGTRLKF